MNTCSGLENPTRRTCLEAVSDRSAMLTRQWVDLRVDGPGRSLSKRPTIGSTCPANANGKAVHGPRIIYHF